MTTHIRADHESISAELNAVKDRVRNLIRDESGEASAQVHWPSDGTFKEVVLRRIIKRSLPDTVRCGTGFVVTESGTSRQLDILVIDSRRPRLFEEGDFYVVTPDCVVAAVEVKSKDSQNHQELSEGLEHLAEFGELCRRHWSSSPCWTGLFVYEVTDGLQSRTILNHLQRTSCGDSLKAVNCVSAGADDFALYWDHNGRPASLPCGIQAWHGYDLTNLAPAYFIGNIMRVISNRYNLDLPEEMWFPQEGGKESKRTGCIDLAGNYKAE